MKPVSRLNVLVVDEDAWTRVSVCEQLRNQGLKVIESSDAEQAIAVLQSSAASVDALVTDVTFPEGRDGFSLADWVRGRYPDIAIAVTTKNVRFSDARPRLAHGAAFVEKPYEVDELISLLRELLQDRVRLAAPSRSVAARESTSTRAADRRRRPVRTS